MEIFKAFTLDGMEHNVHILWENDEPLFRAKEIGRVLDITNIFTSLKSFDDTEKVLRSTYHIHGGEKDTTFLTECGLYKLLMISRKPAARPFQKWVYEVIRSIRKTGKYELERLVEVGVKEALELEAIKYKKDVELVRHKSLVEAFRDRPVVYFGKIRPEADGKFLIKIGSTDDIFERMFSLQREFGSMTLFHVMEAPIHRKFEEYLQTHHKISCYVYKEEIHEGRCSTREVFLMTEEEIENTLAIAKRNVFKFATDAIAGRIMEVHRLKLQAAEARVKEQELRLEVARMTHAEEEDKAESEDDASTNPDITYYERNYTQGRGPKIQRYSPDGKQLLETYPGTAEATRDTSLNTPSGKGIRDAIQRRSVYKGFRWAGLQRDLPDDTFQDIGETVDTPDVRKGLVAMLSLDKTSIVNVFCDQRAAAEDRQFSGCTPISTAIKNGTKSGGHYFQMWRDVAPELQEAYLSHHTLPKKRIPVNARAIEQVHPITGAVIKRFASAADIAKTIRISRNSLKGALNMRHILKGSLWRYETETA
jgi:prophage antirepressor-like protein